MTNEISGGGDVRKPAPFVVLTTQRSGSNWLEERLDSHPDIEMKRSEIFRRSLDSEDSYQTYRAASRGRLIAAHVVPFDVKRRYLRALFASTDAEAVGFRLMYDQLRSNPSLLLLTPASRMRVIHLVRENVLGAHLSIATVKQTGVYLKRKPYDEPPLVVLPIEGLLDDLRSRKAAIDRHRRRFRLLPRLEITYEAYVEAPEEHDRRVLDFLGVDPAPMLQSRWVKPSSGSLADRVANADEVATALSGTEFEWCLT